MDNHARRLTGGFSRLMEPVVRRFMTLPLEGRRGLPSPKAAKWRRTTVIWPSAAELLPLWQGPHPERCRGT